MDETELVQKIIAKDGAAERLFVDTYRPKLIRFASFVLGYQDPDVEDTVQETMLVAFRELPTFQFRCTLLSWLRRICANRCFNRIRKRKWQINSLEGDLDLLSHETSVHQAEEAERKAEEQALLIVLRRERDALDETCRRVLELRDVQGMSYAAIAGKIQTPIGTVMSKLARCKEALKVRVMKALRLREGTHE